MLCLELPDEPGRHDLFNNQIPQTLINLDVDHHLFSLECAELVPYANLRALRGGRRAAGAWRSRRNRT
jgi:hypothetical protein